MTASAVDFQFHSLKLQIRRLFQAGASDIRTIKLGRNDFVYASGVRDSMIYCVESGRVKELLISSEGKKCLLAIHGAGDIFGESCLYGPMSRIEMVTAMQATVLKKMPSRIFLELLKRHSLMDGIVQYLAHRIREQQEAIATSLTANSEQRLAKTLLYMASRHGGSADRGTRIQRLRQEELGEMVGTTRSRTGFFLKRFRGLGLVELSDDRSLIVWENKLATYIESFEFPYGKDTDESQVRDFETPQVHVEGYPIPA